MAKVTLLQINDVHGYMTPHPELFWERGRVVYRTAGGYARLKALVDRVRQEAGGDLIFCDGGDTFHGTYPAVASRGQALLPALNSLGLDAMTGHWDFAYGPARLLELTSQLHYPLLACNVYWKRDDHLVFPSLLVKEIGHLRVGIVGIASVIVDKTMPPSFSEGVRFTLGRDELPPLIEKLRGEEKVDLVVLLSHLGFPQDLKLVAEVKGIDICLSSHTHNRLFQVVRQEQTLVIQSGSHGSFLGRLDLELDSQGVSNYSHRLLEVTADLPEDQELKTSLEAVMAPYQEMLDEPVGQTGGPLDRGTCLDASMDHLLLRAIRETAGSELAFSNGWRYGAPILPGAITMNDLFNIVPGDPTVSTVELSGAEIREMIEENLERTFACDPYRQMGGYVKRCLGLTTCFKMENPPGQRIQKLFVGEAEAQSERVYRAAFVTMQAVPERYGAKREDLPVRAVAALQQYLKRHAPFRPVLEHPFLLV